MWLHCSTFYFCVEKYMKTILDYIYSIYGFENTTKLNLIIGFHSVDKKEEKYNCTHPQPVPSNQEYFWMFKIST